MLLMRLGEGVFSFFFQSDAQTGSGEGMHIRRDPSGSGNKFGSFEIGPISNPFFIVNNTASRVGIGTSSPLATRLHILHSADGIENQPALLIDLLEPTSGFEEYVVINNTDGFGGGQDDSATFKIRGTGTISSGCTDCTSFDLVHTGVINEPDFRALSVRTTDLGTVNYWINYTGSTGRIDGARSSFGNSDDAFIYYDGTANVLTIQVT